MIMDVRRKVFPGDGSQKDELYLALYPNASNTHKCLGMRLSTNDFGIETPSK